MLLAFIFGKLKNDYLFCTKKKSQLYSYQCISFEGEFIWSVLPSGGKRKSLQLQFFCFFLKPLNAVNFQLIRMLNMRLQREPVIYHRTTFAGKYTWSVLPSGGKRRSLHFQPLNQKTIQHMYLFTNSFIYLYSPPQ